MMYGAGYEVDWAAITQRWAPRLLGTHVLGTTSCPLLSNPLPVTLTVTLVVQLLAKLIHFFPLSYLPFSSISFSLPFLLSLSLSFFFVVVVFFPSFPSFGLMIRSQIVPISLSFDEMALGNCFYDSTRFFEIFENSSSFVGKRYTKSEGISLILLLRFLKLSLVSYSILHRDAYTLLLLIPTQMIASGRHTYRNAIIDAIPSFIGSVRYLDSFKTYGTKARSFLNIRALPNNSTFHLFNVNASFAHIAENFQRKTILPSNYSSLSILIFVNKSYLLAPKTTTRNTRREYPDIVTLAMISPNLDPTYHNGVTKQRGKKGKNGAEKLEKEKIFEKEKRNEGREERRGRYWWWYS